MSLYFIEISIFLKEKLELSSETLIIFTKMSTMLTQIDTKDEYGPNSDI